MNAEHALLAAFWGAVSAVSLPIGAALGPALKPSKRVTSAMMAFGGGALLFALTVEATSRAEQKEPAPPEGSGPVERT